MTALDAAGYDEEMTSSDFVPLRGRPRLLRDIPPGTLAQTDKEEWCYRLPDGSGWWVNSCYDRKDLHLVCKGWPWDGVGDDEIVTREISGVTLADMAPGAWERLTSEAQPLPEPHAVPQPGDTLTPDDLDRLPVGAVVDSNDGTEVPWAVKRDDGWDWIARRHLHPLGDGERHWVPRSTRRILSASQVTFIGYDAPLSGNGALRRWCAEHGLPLAIELEREVTDLEARKQIIDAAHSAGHTEDMATSSVTFDGITITQRVGEADADFAQRVAGLRAALAPRVDQAAHTTHPRESAISRFGSALKQIGSDFAGDAARAVVDHKALTLVDVARVGGSRAVAGAVEHFLGENAAIKVLRAAQSPLAPIVTDVLVAVGAAATGAHGLAAVTRRRAAERIVAGMSNAAVERGVGFVTQLAQAVGALGAASAAVELPADETASDEETPSA